MGPRPKNNRKRSTTTSRARAARRLETEADAWQRLVSAWACYEDILMSTQLARD